MGWLRPPAVASGKSAGCFSARLLDGLAGEADAEFLENLAVHLAGHDGGVHLFVDIVYEGLVDEAGAAGGGVVAGEVPVAGVVGTSLVQPFDALDGASPQSYG